LRATTLYGQFSSDFSTSLTQMGEWPNIYNWKLQESELWFTTSREWVVSVALSLMLKSGKDLVYDSQFNGELAVKGGQLTVLQQKHNQIKNIHTWTSAFTFQILWGYRRSRSWII
jgi:hypothetical protein